MTELERAYLHSTPIPKIPDPDNTDTIGGLIRHGINRSEKEQRDKKQLMHTIATKALCSSSLEPKDIFFLLEFMGEVRIEFDNRIGISQKQLGLCKPTTRLSNQERADYLLRN